MSTKIGEKANKLAVALLIIGVGSTTALGGSVEFAPAKLSIPQGGSTTTLPQVRNAV